MLKKMCVIKARWTFQKSKMMGYIPVQRRTDWAMIVQIPALVSPFISCVPAFCAQKVFASFKINAIFPSQWWEYYSITLSKYCESTRLVFFFWRNFIINEGTDGLKPGGELLIVTKDLDFIFSFWFRGGGVSIAQTPLLKSTVPSRWSEMGVSSSTWLIRDTKISMKYSEYDETWQEHSLRKSTWSGGSFILLIDSIAS